jgi:hypothetical protein
MARLESQILRFLLFLEADGRAWAYAGPYDVMAYPGDLYRGGTVGGNSIAGYVSEIDSFYSRIGMPTPGLISPRALHPVVKRRMPSSSHLRGLWALPRSSLSMYAGQWR